MTLKRVTCFLTSLLLSFSIGLVVPSSQAFAEDEDVVVATVNDIPIRKYQVESFKREYMAKSKKETLDKQDIKNLLRNLIRRELLLQKKEVQELRTDPLVKTALSKYETDLIIRRYLEMQVGTQVVATEEEMKQYYQANLQKYASPPRVKCRHILLRDRETAEMVLKKLNEGADFRELAKQYSIDLPMAFEGGDMGVIAKGRALKELEDVLFMLAEGEYSEIVKTQYGFHILMVDEIVPIEFSPYEDVKEEVRKAILKRKEAIAFNEKVVNLEKEADIKVFEDKLFGPPQMSSVQE
jgi:parvulin-like peptidyl-prolyl isomerase